MWEWQLIWKDHFIFMIMKEFILLLRPIILIAQKSIFWFNQFKNRYWFIHLVSSQKEILQVITKYNIIVIYLAFIFRLVGDVVDNNCCWLPFWERIRELIGYYRILSLYRKKWLVAGWEKFEFTTGSNNANSTIASNSTIELKL